MPCRSAWAVHRNFQRTIGTIAITEGLATRVTQKLFPNLPEADSIEFTPGWLKRAREHAIEILTTVRPVLDSDTVNDIQRFTMGPGPNGLEREAYYAGWVIVGDMLAHGISFSKIARIPENEMPQRAKATIDEILAARRR